MSEQLKPGYKQTEVGVIPEDWVIHRIGDSMRLINGRAFKPNDWKQSGLPIIRIQNLNDPESSFNYCSDPVEDKHLITAGDLLFAWSGTTGTSFGARIWNGPTGVLNQHIFKVLPDQKKLTLNYTFLVLQKVQESIEKQAHGFKASFVHVKKSDLVGVELPFPPTIAEQEAIAEALSDADALIASLEQLIAKKRSLKQGAMQVLLTGQQRLPGFEVKPGYQQTEVGVIPVDWTVFSLGELGNFKNGINKNSDAFGHGHPFVNLMDVFGVSSIKSSEALGLVNTNNVEQQTYDLKKGDALFIRSSVKPSGVGLTALVENDLSKTVYSGFLIRFRDKGNFADSFKKFCFYEEGFRQRIIGASSVSANTNINQDNLKKLPIAIPPTKVEQEAIATILSDMDTEISTLEAKLCKARQLKQGMMQELLTGRIRLV